MAAMIIDGDDMDRISELPEAMKLEILSRLPEKDGIEMSTVSKTWKSLPISYFSFTRRTRHINSIDKSLAILHEDQKRIIHYFRVWRIVAESDLIHVDRWLNLITKHIIREIVLDFSFHCESKKYRFPPTRFDVGSLMVLKLYDCVLEETLIQKDNGFNRLKELTLFNTDFDGVVMDLLSRSPNLETLILKPSRGSINKYIY
ncbi:F-box/LRR-repeat protein At3g26922-like [Rosa chinensis]|uniref:F-box/LRR-repeat protein At3g26922-like n=1 Tax=Rosa chinensis TaxID=74649 RepID=UPI000D0974B3|nr:F-box/LRR-repeat protein At3g26922-like [Rosa chinensis]